MMPSIVHDVDIPCHYVGPTATTILSEFPFTLLVRILSISLCNFLQSRLCLMRQRLV